MTMILFPLRRFEKIRAHQFKVTRHVICIDNAKLGGLLTIGKKYAVFGVLKYKDPAKLARLLVEDNSKGLLLIPALHFKPIIDKIKK